MVILDTCSLIEICKNKPGLSKNTLKRVESGAYILSISFAEIACKIKLGKLEMNLSAYDLYEQFTQVPSIEIIKIDVDEWFDSIDLEWEDNRDPADRLLVSFAQKKNIPIVTSDIKIKRFYKKVIW